MTTPTGQLAKVATFEGPVDQAGLSLRMGQVGAVYLQEGKVDITLGAASGGERIPRVPHLSNYQPVTGDYIWVAVNGNDLVVLDRTSSSGPSVISRAAAANVPGIETRTSTAWGDLATPGPSCPLIVSPSGRCLVTVGAHFSNDSATAGAAMSFEIAPWPNAPEFPAGFVSALTTFTVAPTSTQGLLSNRAGAQRVIGGSRTCFLTSIPSGIYRATAKYCTITGGTARFQYRSIEVIPL
ncbi:MAG: hypothetical protein M3N43_01775 [Actinomycetota bacterium]|nr:hypothetical protein [Actinomycetota bacterium]